MVVQAIGQNAKGMHNDRSEKLVKVSRRSPPQVFEDAWVMGDRFLCVLVYEPN